MYAESAVYMNGMRMAYGVVEIILIFTKDFSIISGTSG